MRILIAGSFGYFGLALTRRLAQEHELFLSGRPGRVPGCHAPLSTGSAVVKNVGSVQGLTKWTCADAEAIVHLAGGGAPGGQSVDAAAALRDNVESAVHVASVAPPGARLLLASTIYVYGTGSRPFTERDTPRPDTLYGQLKAVAEAVWRQHGGSALRFSHIYGVGSGVDLKRDGVTERLAHAATGGAPFTMHGDGSQRIDLVHIDDACEAVALALRAPELPPALNVSGGAPVMVRDLAEVFGVRPVLTSAEPRSDAARLRSLATQAPGAYGELRAMDCALAAEVLGWKPQVALAEGARDLIEMSLRAQSKSGVRRDGHPD